MISAKEVAAIAAKALDSKLGKDISLIEIADVSTLADYFLICTATSNTHVKTLCDAVTPLAGRKSCEFILDSDARRLTNCGKLRTIAG